MSNWNADNYYYNQEQSFNNLQSPQFHLGNLHTDTFHNFSGSYPSTYTRSNASGYNNTAANNLQSTTLGETSTHKVPNFIDISHSNLTATAAEFKPRNQSVVPTASSAGNGTIKKSQQNIRSKKTSTNKFSQAHAKSFKNQYSNISDQIDATELKENDDANDTQFSKEKNRRSNIALDQTGKELNEENRDSKEKYKNYFRNKFSDQYAKNNGGIDFKKKWSKNSHSRYNRKYDAHEHKNPIQKENWRQPSNGAGETNKQNKIWKSEQQLDFKCKSRN